MAAAATAHDADRAEMRRRRWAVYDDELEDSDQTISAFRRAAVTSSASTRRAPTAPPLSLAHAPARTSQPASRKRPPVKSAYFFETTDDEELSRHGGATAAATDRLASSGLWTGRTNATASSMQTIVPTPPAAAITSRLHIGEIQFPVTRSVLWDRRVLAEPIGVSVEQVLPRFTATADALKHVFELFQTRLAAARASDLSRESDVLCYLCGDAASMLSAKQLVLSKVVMTQQRKDKWDSNVVWMPVYVVPGPDAPLQLPQAMYASTITAAQQAVADEKNDALAPRLQPRLLVAPSSVHGAQLEFQVECCAPPLLFRFALIRSLPLLMTPLAASLSRQEFGSGAAVRRSGYLTLDRARKAVPVLRTDPLVLQRPIVGVWVYGVPLSDEWNDAAASAQLADPFLYFACMGYVASRTIKERAEVSKNTFLVAMYPSGATASSAESHPLVTPLPRFFECSYSEHVADVRENPAPIELFAQQRSCLVGVSSFSADVDFAVSSSRCETWERAKQQLGVPTTTRASVNQSDADVRSESVVQRQATERTESMAQPQSRGSAWEMASQTRRPLAASAGPTTRGVDARIDHAPMTRSRSDWNFRSDDAIRSFSRVTFANPRASVAAKDDDANEGEDPPPLSRSAASMRTQEPHTSYQASEERASKENEQPNVPCPADAGGVESSTSDRKDPIRSANSNVSVGALPAAMLPSADSSNDSSVDDLEHRERSDSSAPMRSCCKSQALLTIQHQQILENQQRQLHEMQAQIAHLRHLLRATQTMIPEKFDGDDLQTSRVSSTSGDSVQIGRETAQNDCYDHHDEAAESEVNLQVHRGESLARSAGAHESDDDTQSFCENTADPSATLIGGGDSATGDGDGEHRQGLDSTELDLDYGNSSQNEPAADNVSENESSLHLSSISSASMRSDLSSLSSSLVGARMKTRLRESSGRVTNQLSDSRASVASSSGSSSSAGSARSATSRARSRESKHVSDERRGSRSGAARVRDTTETRSQDTAARSKRFALAAAESESKHEVDDDDDEDDLPAAHTVCEKMLTPDSYLKRHGAFVDRHGGSCYTAPTLDVHSFCVPRIKFTGASSPRGFGGSGLSDSEDEEFRLIEQKYKRLLAS